MIPKLYALLWLLVVGSAAVLYFTGNLNDIMLTVFAFVFSTLFFGFFIAVLPWWTYKIHEPKYHNR